MHDQAHHGFYIGFLFIGSARGSRILNLPRPLLEVTSGLKKKGVTLQSRGFADGFDHSTFSSKLSYPWRSNWRIARSAVSLLSYVIKAKPFDDFVSLVQKIRGF